MTGSQRFFWPRNAQYARTHLRTLQRLDLDAELRCLTMEQLRVYRNILQRAVAEGHSEYQELVDQLSEAAIGETN